MTLARDLLLGAGIRDPNAFLSPLATASAAGAAERGASALTGPVRRGDAGMIRRHLDELRASSPECMGQNEPERVCLAGSAGHPWVWSGEAFW